MTAPAPIRHPAPAGELRLEWPGKCWVWAWSAKRGWSAEFLALYRKAWGWDINYVYGGPGGWWAIRTRGPRPPWPTFINQRDPGDEIEADGFITYTGPSEGFTTPAGGG